jgi:hypothetical protein
LVLGVEVDHRVAVAGLSSVVVQAVFGRHLCIQWQGVEVGGRIAAETLSISARHRPPRIVCSTQTRLEASCESFGSGYESQTVSYRLVSHGSPEGHACRLRP